jgi:L-amino acid N-acyltransferase YncA
MDGVSIETRLAAFHDRRRIAAIYNAGIEERTATFETRPRRTGEITAWLAEPDTFPVIVAESRGVVVGWARVGPYSDRDAYRGVGECQVYVDPQARGRGVGTRLLSAICGEAEARGYWKLLGRLFAANEASRALVRRCGFREVGAHHRHARLDGEWRDVIVVERLLGEADAERGHRVSLSA